jgi:tRNA pseudouridine38-40 synthase
MARYQVILAYDGTLFAGFQRQPRARTVQGEVEDALRQLGWQGRAILAAGRTDTGVHASGNVVAFDLDWAHPVDALVQALNARLPEDVAAQSARTADADFHPRYDALARRYRYRLISKPERDPLIERFAWRAWPAVDLERMRTAAALFVGIHDFAAFGAPTRPGASTIREVMASDWREKDGGWIYEVQGNAFLYHMVRRMVFLQVQVGQGKLEPDDLAAGLNGLSQPTAQIHGLAPAQGLTLVEVRYGGPLALEDKIDTVSSKDPNGFCADAQMRD